MDNKLLKQTSFARRIEVLEMVKHAKTGHIGGSMSCMDILVTLYYEIMDINLISQKSPNRDRFILSKGHCAEALYTILADKDFISKETLQTYANFDSILAEHPTMKVNGIEVATGALGHGLSIGVGMSIGLKSDKSLGRVYVLLGDGELAEGSNWEAVMSAAKYKLNNLSIIIDRNHLQISGNTEDVMPLDNLIDKFQSFGWECRVCNGHEPYEIFQSITKDVPTDKPLAIIANTIKGYGSQVMENKADWHHLVPTDTQYEEIKSDLMQRRDNRG